MLCCALLISSLVDIRISPISSDSTGSMDRICFTPPPHPRINNICPHTSHKFNLKTLNLIILQQRRQLFYITLTKELTCRNERRWNIDWFLSPSKYQTLTKPWTVSRPLGTKNYCMSKFKLNSVFRK